MRSNLFIALSLLVSATPSFAMGIDSAVLSADGQSIKVSGITIGGCSEHNLTPSLQSCAETFPVQCQVKVIDSGAATDGCEALIPIEGTFKLKEMGINPADPYFKNASLRFFLSGGDKGAVVQLKN